MNHPLPQDDRFDDPPPRRREPVFNMPTVVLALIAACVGVHIVRAYALDPEADFEVLLRFAFIPLRYSGLYAIDIYAWISPITYSFLHGDIVHLVVNMVWLAAFGSPLANRFGNLRFTLFWVVTALAAVGLHYVLHPGDATPLVGASGAISGMMGAAARFAFRVDRSERRAAFEGPVLSIPRVFTHRTTVAFLGVWMAVNLAVGLTGGGFGPDGQIAWEAHIGGFLAGFFGVRLFDAGPRGPNAVRNAS